MNPRKETGGAVFDFKEVTVAQHRELDPQRANFINELKGDCKMTIERCPELKHTLGGRPLYSGFGFFVLIVAVRLWSICVKICFRDFLKSTIIFIVSRSFGFPANPGRGMGGI